VHEIFSMSVCWGWSDISVLFGQLTYFLKMFGHPIYNCHNAKKNFGTI